MGHHAGDVLDRLTLTPRSDRGVQRVGLGAALVDAQLSGGIARGGLHEIRAPLARDMGAAAGLLVGMLARLGGEGRVLWVTDPGVTPDAGLLNPDGLAQMGFDPARITLVHAVDLKTALWAADEGARCTDLAAVVLHVKGNPARLDRVAMRRLMLRGQGSGVTVFVLRQSGAEEAGAAHTRWSATPRRSRDPGFPAGLGLPTMDVALERTRDGRTGRFALTWDLRQRRFENDSTTISEPFLPASAHRPDRPGQVGQVVALGRAP